MIDLLDEDLQPYRPFNHGFKDPIYLSNLSKNKKQTKTK